MTPALEAEGFSREIIRRIQQMRKDMGLNVEEFIRVDLECSPKIEGVLDQWKDPYCRETRRAGLDASLRPKGEYIVEWNVAGEPLLIGITSLKMKQSLDAMAALPGMSMGRPWKPFDDGFTSIEALRAATTDHISVIEGVTKLDAKRIFDHLHKDEARPAAAPAPAGPAEAQPECPSRPRVRAPSAAGTAPSFMSVLRSVEGIDQGIADALYDAEYGSAQSFKTAAPGDLAKVKGVSELLAARLVEVFSGETVETHARPPPAAARHHPRLPSWRGSFSYLVEEDKPETSYNLFRRV